MSILSLNCNPELLYGKKSKFIMSTIQLVTSSKSEVEVSTHDV